MRSDNISNYIITLQETVLMMILDGNMMNDEHKVNVFKSIERLLEENKLEMQDIVTQDIMAEYQKALRDALVATNTPMSEFKNKMAHEVHAKSYEMIINDSLIDLQSAYRTAKITTYASIENAIYEVRSAMSSGLITGLHSKQVGRVIADRFMANGLKAFITVDGRVLPLDFYAQTVARTKLSQARTYAHRNHFVDVGNDLYTIKGAYDTCQECASYQNIVFSISGSDDRFKHLDPVDILPIHPNCRCSVVPYIAHFEDDDDVERESDKSLNHDPTIDTRTKKQRDLYERSQRFNRQKRAELKQYDEIKTLLGDDAPKTLGAFRRMKRQNTKGYRNLRRQLRALRRDLK